MAKKITVTFEDLKRANTLYEAERAEETRLREEAKKEMLEQLIAGINQQLEVFENFVRHRGLQRMLKMQEHVATCMPVHTKYGFKAIEFLPELNEKLNPAGFEAQVVGETIVVGIKNSNS